MHIAMKDTKAFGQLLEQATKPFDLTATGAIGSDRIDSFLAQSHYFSLLYATQRIDEDCLSLLGDLAKECKLVEQFKSMRRGAVLNAIAGVESEQRQVLHTATRDVFSSSPAEPNSTNQAKRELDKLRHFLQEIDDGVHRGSTGKPFDTMIQVGIGGSDLGPRAIFEALRPFGVAEKKVHFISNVDPDDAAAVLQQVELETTLVNIVSKSGSTLETLTNEMLVKNALENHGLDPAKHCIAVTGEGSPMDSPENYLQSFYMFDYIGGRYSATSMVGCVMLGFYLGYDALLDFLGGANDIDMVAEQENIRENIPLLMALIGIWNHNFLGHPSVAILPYSQALHRFPAHLQQCDMESNGKSVTRDGEELTVQSGPVVWGEPGTNGQHAFYQLLHQGTEIVPVEFVGFLENQYAEDLVVQETLSQEKLVANLLAQSVALATGKEDTNPNKNFAGNRPNSILLGKMLTPRTMGALLAIYEAKIVFQGFAWNINSFDQEGVQLGKVLANRFLDVMRGNQPTPDDLETHLLSTVTKQQLSC